MDNVTSFIEQQFPVSKISKESYKERKAGSGQTLTGLGKWWGRKPLILCRAAIIGCLMPASDNPKKDTEIFLKILSMDNDGLVDRKIKSISAQELYDIAKKSKHFRQYLDQWFEKNNKGKVAIKKTVEKKDIELRLFKSLGYDEKLNYCCRPEQLSNINEGSWSEINEHLGTNAHSLSDLIVQLSAKRYGRTITVGDCFCGGGSIPFEAARIGLYSYGSDLNPVAGLLSWGNNHFAGLSDSEFEQLEEYQTQLIERCDTKLRELGVEWNENGDRAVNYYYCNETKCPECGGVAPLIPSFVIRTGTGTIAKIRLLNGNYKIDVISGATAQEMSDAKNGTVTSKGFVCPHCGKTTPISVLRHDRIDEHGATVYGLRRWKVNEFESQDTDVFHEVLYAICYVSSDGSRYYRAPNETDLKNEEKVRGIVKNNFEKWQRDGLVPTSAIESGYNTDQLIRERGWSYWHQLFNCRQILTNVIFQQEAKCDSQLFNACALLSLNKMVNWNSKLCIIVSARESGGITQTFANQALNTLFNYGTRTLYDLRELLYVSIPRHKCQQSTIVLSDARAINTNADYWITDPPYADAVNYHELSEFFLAWDKELLKQTFPEWYSDSKRILAVRGDDHFSQTMIEIYSNLTMLMPDDGMQVVMFTHSDPAVWAQLALIMWKSGLRVTAAWNIATETESGGLKDGNYVKGTVLLVLRKQTGDDLAFLDEISSDIRNEVRKQIASMINLDSKEEPNFSDPDFVLAAYAASLKVLTSYKTIEDLDLDYELNLAINNPSQSSIVKIIENAKKIAYDCVIPAGFDNYLWKELSNSERFYIKGLESEKRNDYSISTYQEFARGFSLGGYNQLMAVTKANAARLKTPMEMANRTINEIPDFENSLMRTIFMGIYTGVKEDESPAKALGFIKNELSNYWDKRDMIKQILRFLIDAKDIENMAPHWDQSANMAELLLSLVTNDSI